MEAEYTKAVKCPHKQKSQGLSLGELVGCTSERWNVSVCEQSSYKKIFPSFGVGEFTPEICPRILDTRYIIYVCMYIYIYIYINSQFNVATSVHRASFTCT